MSSRKRGKKHSMPPYLPILLDGMVREALINNPEDIYKFLAQYTARLLEEEKQGKNPYQKHYTTKGDPGGDWFRDGEDPRIKTEVLADGTRISTAPDGTKTVVKPDGTKIITAPDGSTIELCTDGTRIEVSLDGTKIITAPDGSTLIITPDGTKNFNGANCSTVEVTPDGARTYVGPPGSYLNVEEGCQGAIKVGPNGDFSYRDPSGAIIESGAYVKPCPGSQTPSKTGLDKDATTTWYADDGTKIQEFADCTTFVIKPDGTRFIIGKDGARTFKGTDQCMLEVRCDGARSYVGPPESTFKIGHEASPKTLLVKSDGSLLYINAEGISVQVNADGSVSGDKGKLLQLPDGTKLIGLQDGTMIQIAVDGTKRFKGKDKCMVEVKPNGAKNYVGGPEVILEAHTKGKPEDPDGLVQVASGGIISYKDANGGVVEVGADGDFVFYKSCTLTADEKIDCSSQTPLPSRRPVGPKPYCTTSEAQYDATNECGQSGGTQTKGVPGPIIPSCLASSVGQGATESYHSLPNAQGSVPCSEASIPAAESNTQASGIMSDGQVSVPCIPTGSAGNPANTTLFATDTVGQSGSLPAFPASSSESKPQVGGAPLQSSASAPVSFLHDGNQGENTSTVPSYSSIASSSVASNSTRDKVSTQPSRDRVAPFNDQASWAKAVQGFLDRNIEFIRRILTGEMTAGEASGILLPLTVAIVVGIVLGYAVKSTSLASCPGSGKKENTLRGFLTGFLSSAGAGTAAAGTGKCPDVQSITYRRK